MRKIKVRRHKRRLRGRRSGKLLSFSSLDAVKKYLGSTKPRVAGRLPQRQKIIRKGEPIRHIEPSSIIVREALAEPITNIGQLSQRDKLNSTLDVIKELEREHKYANRGEIVSIALARSPIELTPTEIHDTINKLKRVGYIYEPKEDYFRIA